MEIVHDTIDLEFPEDLRPSRIKHDVPLDDLLERILIYEDDVFVHVHLLTPGPVNPATITATIDMMDMALPPLAHRGAVVDLEVTDDGLHITVDTTNQISIVEDDNIHLITGDHDDGFCYVAEDEIYDNTDELPPGNIWIIDRIHITEIYHNDEPTTIKPKSRRSYYD